MRFQIASILAFVGLVAANPASYPTRGGYNPFPLPDGFPNPSPQSLQEIQRRAGGTLPNGPLPPNPGSAAAALDLQVIAFNEIFEVAYFTQLRQNVSNNVPGYEVPSKWGKSYILRILDQVIAQEELHAILANTALKAYGGQAIQPASYQFPVNSLLGALDFAGTFTSLVLGALKSVQVDLTEAMAPQLVQVVGSIIGQEGEQTGFYRAVNNRVPSASPFLTNAAGQYAYNALTQMVVFPGSNPNRINIPAYDPLTVRGTPQARNSTLSFQVRSRNAPTSSSHITYLTGQNVPVVVPITNIRRVASGVYSFDANFPYQSGFSAGLSIAALTKNAGPFANSSAVAAATTAGPGLIYIN